MNGAAIEPDSGDSENESGSEPLKPVVLELRNVTYRSSRERGMRLSEVSMTVRGGELAVIGIDSSLETRGFASLIQGLSQPSTGQVLFRFQDWKGDDYDRHFQMRSRIGRVFDDRAWIENLNVEENVTLARRHHGDTPESISREVRYWLDQFGVEDLTRKRPAFVDPSILQWHQWIRAFLGKPELLILERPMRSLPTEWFPRLSRALNELRAGGSAALWMTNRRDMDQVRGAMPSQEFEVEGNQLRAVDVGGKP